MKKKPQLSIVVLSCNTKDLLKDCLESLEKVKDEVTFEVIVPDNGSTDGSIEMLKEDFKWVKLIENGENLGFAAGNNRTRSYCKGEYVLFLNSDTIVKKKTLKKSIDYIKENKEIGALSCKLVLPTGELDKDARRSFPTPWVSFTHFSKLDRIFSKSPLFAQYWYGYMDENTIHEVDVIQGAYFLTRKKLLDEMAWFDEDYFLDGEDIDLCWKIKKRDFKILYYPEVSIIHVKGATKGKGRRNKKKVSLKERLKFRMAGVNSMEIFYKKRLWKQYPLLLNLLVLLGIKLLKLIRLMTILLS